MLVEHIGLRGDDLGEFDNSRIVHDEVIHLRSMLMSVSNIDVVAGSRMLVTETLSRISTPPSREMGSQNVRNIVYVLNKVVLDI